MEILKDLIGLEITNIGISLNVTWMFLFFAWPIIVFELWVHWRAIKSFFRKTKIGNKISFFDRIKRILRISKKENRKIPEK